MTENSKNPETKYLSVDVLTNLVKYKLDSAENYPIPAAQNYGIKMAIAENAKSYKGQCNNILEGLEEMRSAGYEGKIPVPAKGSMYEPVMDVIKAWRETQATPADRGQDMNARVTGKVATHKKLQK